jgi:hypothetical protein
MENMGWIFTTIVALQVICHVANTIVREYFSRADRLRDLLRERGHDTKSIEE